MITSPTVALPPAKILIVDDSSVSRSVILDIIRSIEGCEGIECANGPEALEQAKTHDFAAIILDIEMPGMDGFMVAEKLHALNRPIGPILFITSLDLKEDMIDKAYILGALDFIHKPVRPAVIRAKIQGYCNQYWQHFQLIDINKKLEALSDQAHSASNAKSLFVANMSHEIRTPLNGILGTVDLLKKTKLNDVQKRYTDIITSSGEALLGILNDTLDLAKIEAGRTTVHKTTFDLDPFLKTTTEPHLPRAAMNRVELMIRTHAGVPTTLTTDPQLLKQILFNLLSNAVKFTLSGSVILDISLIYKKYLRLSVIDTGIGIPADRLNDVFEIFTQVDPSTTRNYGGTGLGLAITHNLVNLLGGTIHVESIQGKGTTFFVDILCNEILTPTVPIDRSVTIIAPDDSMRQVLAENLNDIGVTSITFMDEPNTHRIESSYTTNDIIIIRQSLLLHTPPFRIEEWFEKLGHRFIILQGSSDITGLPSNTAAPILYALHQRSDLLKLFTMTKLKSQSAVPDPNIIAIKGSVLLVEDDPINRMIATEILEQLGYTVAIAENGLKAVEKARIAQYDTILMDCMMPNMDGYQATHLIRTTDNMNRDTRIIALTASVMESDRQKALASGMNDFLGKPFRRKDLAEKLEQK